jgi:hypothetical protein
MRLQPPPKKRFHPVKNHVIVASFCTNNMLFLSFRMSQQLINETTWMSDHTSLPNTNELQTCNVCALTTFDNGLETILIQRDWEESHSKNKWLEVSATLQPLVHTVGSARVIPCFIKFSFDNNLLFNNLQAKSEIFKGKIVFLITSLCDDIIGGQIWDKIW